VRSVALWAGRVANVQLLPSNYQQERSEFHRGPPPGAQGQLQRWPAAQYSVRRHDMRGSTALRKLSIVLLLAGGIAGCNPSYEGTSPLFRAVRSGEIENVHALLRGEADPNDRFKYSFFGSSRIEGNRYSWDPHNGTSVLMIASEKGSVSIASALLTAGADPNLETRIGKTALMFAAEKCHLEVAKLLLGRGANIRAVATGGSNHLGADLSGSVLRFALNCALWKDGTSDVAKLVLDHLKPGDLPASELTQCLDWRYQTLPSELKGRIAGLRRP
jgi:ankyrin repeat protein